MAAAVKIYTRKWCGYCTAATRFLNEKGVAFEEIDCTGDNTTRKWLLDTTHQSTVPQIFIADRSIGGYDDMRALDRRGELDRMLAGESAQGSSSG
ncbi:MAG: glutaredoxin 3 [Myxococcales bacterium]|nr:glutaredoxin 3 [Myxococcales bacterium]